MALELNLGQPAAMPINVDRTTLRNGLTDEIAQSSQFNRGWQAAGYGEDANSLMSKSLAARRSGDEQGGAVYEQQARDLLAQSQQWAPTVQNMTDVTGLRSGLDWAGGALGNVRSSIMPALGGVGGAIVGGAGGALIGGLPGAATGARYGASIGAGLLGGKTEYDEAVGNAMIDPTIRSTRSYDDIHNAALAKGGINAVLEGLVPASMAKSVLGLTGKAALKKAAEQGALKTLGKEVGKNAAEEFGTEGAQSLVGQGAENWLKQKDITDFDYKQALNEGAAGAIAGAGMGVAGGAGNAAHAALGTGVDAVKDFTNKTTSDHIADAGAFLGRKRGESDAKQYVKTDEELAAMAKNIADNIQNQHRDFSTVPTSEAGLGDDQKVAAADARAMKHAETIRDNPGDYTQGEREAAAKFMAHKQFGQFDKDLTNAKDNDALNSLTSEVESKSPKNSDIGSEGDTAHRLTDLWLERHGSEIGAFGRQKGSDLAKRAATALMGWVNSGFGAAHSEDGTQTFIPRALLDHFGDDAPKIVKTMTELASKQGTMVDKSQITRVIKEVSQHVDDQTGDHTFLTNKLTPLADAHWTTEKSTRIAKLLRDNHGKVSSATRSALKESFGDNVDAVVEHFKPKVKESTDVYADGNSPNTPAKLDQEELDYENEQSAQSSERINEGRRYVGQSKTNEYFDTQNDFHKNQFDRMAKEQTAAKGADDAVGRSAKKVGKIDREIEKAAEAAGTTVEDMSQAAKDKVVAKIVHEMHPELEKVTKSIKGESKLAQQDHTARRQAYEKKLARYAREINNRFQTMRVEETEGSAPGINFSDAEVKALELDYDLRDPFKVKGTKNNGIQNPTLSPANGRIVLERNGKPFVTTTQMLMAKMFNVRDNTTESTKDYKGTAQMAMQRVSDAIASVQQHEGFSGRIGVVRNGKIEWQSPQKKTSTKGKAYTVEASLPNDLRLWRSKDGVSHHVGTAKGQLAVQSATDTTSEFDPSEISSERGKNTQSAVWKRTKETRQGPDGESGAQIGTGTLSDLDPEVEIKRDKFGNAVTGSDTMTAGAMVGRSTSGTKPVETRTAGEKVVDKRVVSSVKETAEAGPTPKVKTPERQSAPQNSAPFSSKAQVELNKGLGRGNTRPLRTETVEAIKSLVAQMPGLQGLMGNVIHIAAALTPKILHEGHAYAVAQPLPKLGGIAILLSPRSLVHAHSDSKADTSRFSRQFAHEVGHSLESFANVEENFGRTTEIAKEAEATEGHLRDIFGYPLDFTDAVLKKAHTTFASELHSQAFGLYMAQRTLLQKQMPATFNLMESLYGKDGSIHHNRADGKRSNSIGVEGKEQVAGSSSTTAGGQRASDGKSTQGTASHEQRKERLLKELKDAKPVSIRHGNALREAIAILEGKDGNLVAALDKVVAASEYFGKANPKTEIDADIQEMNDALDEYRYDMENEGYVHEPYQHMDEPMEPQNHEVLRDMVAKHGDQGKNKFWTDAANQALRSGDKERIASAIQIGEKKFGAHEASAPSKPSKQSPKGPAATQEQQDEAKAAITKIIGDKIKVLFDKKMKSAGSWAPQQTMNMIKLSINGDVMGAAFHESFHEIMDILRTNGGDKAVAILERAAMNPMMQNRLRQALEGHPQAQKQLAKPEEAAAFMFQMWMANPAGFKIGPDTKTLFDHIKSLLRSIAGVVSESVRKANIERKQAGMEALTVENLLRDFAGGSLANVATRKAVVEAMDKVVAQHNAAVENVGSAFRTLTNSAGKLVFSAEAMMDATGSKYMVEIARMFHQKAGTAMQAVGKSFGGYSDGVRQQTSMWLNKAENILMAADKGDIELARQHLSNGTNSTDPKVQKVVTALRGFMNEMRDYIDKKDVRVLDEDHQWKKVKFRNNYWPQVIDMKFLGAHMQEFKDDLLKYHMDALEGIAAKANAEMAAGDASGANTASDMMSKKSAADQTEITPEHIAEAIVTRLLNSQGSIDIDEDSSNLGMTPAARAVNRRVLDFLDPSFDKYMSKDVTNIVTNYAHSVVKRAEYQSRFGYGGEKIKELSDKAILHELGGDELIAKAEARLGAAQEQWKKTKGKQGGLNEAPFPTLRSVGQKIHEKAVGTEKHHEALLKAVKKMEQGNRAIQAMEGTLGNDISAGARAIGSWLVTYQNFRLLSTMLFMSFQDVMGIVREGGEMGDAWKAFTTGMSEIKNTWSKTKTPNEMMERSEFWGAVDAGSFADAVAQSHGSVYMTGKAKEMSDKFFKYTGAEGWNRGVRGVAASVAERIITEWKREGIDAKDKAVQARVERLFGKGFDVANIKMDDKGRLDISDPLNQAAVTRWVLDAVPAPTAAHRPIWGSDPHFQAFMHLKNYTYTFHRVVMKGAVEQAKLGNYRPAAVLALGYVPIAIAAGAMKEMLIPGDEPPWMKGGLDGYLSYGFARAGLLGVPQMYSESLFNPTQLLDHPTKAFDNFDPAALFGPTADQAQNILSIPFMEDHGVIGESLGSLPGGNLIKRLERIGTTGK